MMEEERPDYVRIAAELRLEADAARIAAMLEPDRSVLLERKAMDLARAARVIEEDAVNRQNFTRFRRAHDAP